MGVRGSFRPTEPKNVWFPLSRHDVRRVHKKFFLADSRELISVRVISGSWAQKRPKTFDSHFLDMMYLEFMKTFFLPDMMYERTDGC